MARYPSDDVHAALRTAASKHAVPITLLMGVAFVESSFDPHAVGQATSTGAHAQGLMQLMPTIQARYDVTDPYDPMQSADAGAQLLAAYGKALKWDVDAMLAAYHLGAPKFAAAASALPSETRDYVRRVKAARLYYEQQAGSPEGPTYTAQLNAAITSLLRLNPTWAPIVLVARSWSTYYAQHEHDSGVVAVLDPALKLHWAGYRKAYERAPLTDGSTPYPTMIEPDQWIAANRAIKPLESKARALFDGAKDFALSGAFGAVALLAVFLMGRWGRR